MQRSTHHTRRRRSGRAAAAMALVAVIALAGCGSDDDSGDDGGDDATASTPADAPSDTSADTSADTTVAPTPETTAGDHSDHTAPATDETIPQGTVAPAGAQTAGFADFCAAEVELETAIAMGDPALITPAMEAVSAAAPEDAKEITDRTIAAATEFMSSGSEPSEEFDAAYGEFIQIVKDNCEFSQLEVAATNYAFGGIPPEVSAGPAVITLVNTADEYHELVLLKRNEGVTEPIEELLALPEEEAMTKVQPGGVVFAAPDATAYTVADLTPGDWVAICFLPVGATEEAMAESETTGSMPQGEPHFAHGMVTEFTVS